MKAYGRWGHFFGTAVIEPVLGPEENLAMSPSPTVHGGQHGTKYDTCDKILHATFVAIINCDIASFFVWGPILALQ